MVKLYFALLNLVAIVNAVSFSTTEIDSIRTMLLDTKSFTQSMDFVQQHGDRLGEVFEALVYIDFDQYDHVALNNLIGIMALDDDFLAQYIAEYKRISRSLDISTKRQKISQYYYDNLDAGRLYDMDYETVISWLAQWNFDSNETIKYSYQDLMRFRRVIVGSFKHNCFKDMLQGKNK